MAKNVDRSTLGYLGEEFQLKLVKCFFEDKNFFINLETIIDQNMFTNEYLRRIVGFLKSRYNEKDVVASYGEMDILIRKNISDQVTVMFMLELLDKIKNIDLVGLDLIEGESERFFKQQNLVKAINKANDIIKRGNGSEYYEIEDLFKKALDVNTKQEYGWHLFDDVENDLRDDYRETIPTGTKELDDALYGGLGRGELGVVIAPSGVGKTSICTGFAASAAVTKTKGNNYQGYKVLHFYFEDADEAIRRKYYGHILDIDAMHLSDPDIRPRAIEELKNLKEEQQLLKTNIIGKRLASGEETASMIKRRIESYIAKGFKPDLVIIDYFECLKSEDAQNFHDTEWTKEGITMRKLESICNEKQIAMWVPIQGNKGSLGAEFVGLMHGGGSVSKIQIGHVVITLARTEEQKSQHRLNVFIQKLRGIAIGRDKFLNVKFNNGTCKFDMTDTGDLDDEVFENSMQNRQNQVAMSVRNNLRKKP